MKKDQDIEFKLSSKHVGIRTILFIVSLIVAISGLGYGTYKFATKNKIENGWITYDLENYKDNNYLGYSDNIMLCYYLDNVETSAVVKNKSILNSYPLIAKRYYSLYNEFYQSSNGVHGIKYINDHIGEEIQIDKELYDVLLDAYNKTMEEGSLYSIFSGMLYAYWQDRFLYNEDPLITNGRETLLIEITNVCKDLTNFSLDLTFKNDLYYATLNANDKTKEIAKENNYPILSLNQLMYSYYLDSIAGEFEKVGLTKGYFYTYTGEMIFMSNAFINDNSIVVYDRNKSSNLCIPGTINNKGKCVVSSIRNFALSTGYDSNFVFNSFTYNGELISRSTFYSYKTGYSNNNFRNSVLVDDNDESKLYDLTYKNINLTIEGNVDKYSEKLNSDIYAAVIINNNNNDIYLSDVSTYYKDYRYIDSTLGDMVITYNKYQL